MATATKVLLLGPAPPFRGGIADTQLQLALALQEQNRNVSLATFTHLYPKLFFPGKTQYRQDAASREVETKRIVHAYNPFQWAQAAEEIKKIAPDILLFRYYTPFLAPAYIQIARKLKNIKKIALVDNWWPHERKPWDAVLNRQFGKQMEGLATLSELVGDQILASGISKPLWKGFHPIANDLPPLLSQKEARNALNWPQESPIVLFYGLIRPYKGLDLLLKAFAEPALKNTTIKLAVVGESYENFSKYKLLIHKLGLEDSVLLDLNFADSNKTQQVFSACNLVAQTYHTATQSGVTPLAYHFEKPILASDIPGLREPILKDQTGILIQKTPAAIAEGVLKLLYNQEFKVAQLNLKLQQENYRWTAFAKNLLDFMESSKMS